MQADDVRRLAETLRTAETDRRAIAPLKASHPAMTLEDAYAIQLANVRHRIDRGGRIVGKKVGLTSKAMQSFLGVAEPDFGHLFDDMLFDEESVLPLGRFLQPKVEAEIAFVLGATLKGPGVTVLDVLAATRAVVPSFEIIASRIVDWKIGIEDTIADNGSSAGLVLGGRPMPVDAVDLKHVGLVLEKNGRIIDTAAGAAVLGHPAVAVAWLANKLGSMNVALEEGEVVLAGSLTKAYEVAPGDVFTATFGGLGSVKAVFSEN
ncbi:MAG: 2-keto-4-pentenoate hydratase [Phyllobacteriaceae bacterium]|nr:2-keto-4-pentenoate hydratase [Phyllobacteriaceae bacterium]